MRGQARGAADAAVLVHQGPGLLPPAELQLDERQPPGQLGVGAAGQDEVLAPDVDGRVGVRLAQVDHAAEEPRAEGVLVDQVVLPLAVTLDPIQEQPRLFHLVAAHRVVGRRQEHPRVVRGQLQGGLELGGGLRGVGVEAVAAEIFEAGHPRLGVGRPGVGPGLQQGVHRGVAAGGVLHAVAEQPGQPRGALDVGGVLGQRLAVFRGGFSHLLLVVAAGQAVQGRAEDAVGRCAVVAAVDHLPGDLHGAVVAHADLGLALEVLLGDLGDLVAVGDVEPCQAAAGLLALGPVGLADKQLGVELRGGQHLRPAGRGVGLDLRQQRHGRDVVGFGLEIPVEVARGQLDLALGQQPLGGLDDAGADPGLAGVPGGQEDGRDRDGGDAQGGGHARPDPDSAGPVHGRLSLATARIHRWNAQTS